MRTPSTSSARTPIRLTSRARTIVSIHERPLLGCAGGAAAGAALRRRAHAATCAWPVAARTTDSSSASVARELAGDPALVHDQHAVGHPEHLGQLGGDHQHREALARELGHQAVHLGLGADVDAARRLVDDQDLRAGGEPLAEHDLLLVAARQEADGVGAAGGT